MKELSWIGFLLLCLFWSGLANAASAEQYCDSIYLAEGGQLTRHPYGILKTYKHTTARQACINTVNHAFRDWRAQGSKGSFIDFLGNRYCPIGSDTDDGTCRYWVKNVKANLK